MRLLTVAALSALSVLTASASASASSCDCNPSRLPAARAPSLNISGPALPNIALDIASLSLALLGPSPLFPPSPGAAHKIAVVAAAVYDAHAFAHATATPLTPARASAPAVAPADRQSFVGYAAYFALTRVLADEPAKSALLHSRMFHLGYDADVHTSHPAVAGVKALLMKLMPMMGPGAISPPNPPSPSFDADCSLAAGGAWQPQCVQAAPGEACAPQKVPFAILFNTTLIAAAGGRAGIYAAQAADPPVWDGRLDGVRTDGGEFARAYREVLDVSAKIGDAEKASAEFFQPPGFVSVAALALGEAVARALGEAESAALMFAVSAAARDSVATAATLKLSHYATRPVTVIQCGYAGQMVTAWNKPYYGVRQFVNGGADGETWRPYLQTPSFPGWVSGHSAVAAAGAAVLERWFVDGVQSANCAVLKKGMSKTEPMLLKGTAGYVAGVTDVPNSGQATIGYSPARDVRICWSSFAQYAEQMSESRLLGGIHIAKDNDDGLAVGKIVGNAAYDYVMTLYKK